jgi:hypothetical protein
MSTQQEGNPTQTKAILTMEEGGKIILELDRAQARR